MNISRTSNHGAQLATEKGRSWEAKSIDVKLYIDSSAEMHNYKPKQSAIGAAWFSAAERMLDRAETWSPIYGYLITTRTT